MTLRDSCAAAFVALVWGVNFVVIELGLAEVPPLLFAAVRFAVVAFPAVLFIRRPEAPWRVVVAIGATVSLGQFGLLYSALHLGMPAGVASLVLQAQVMFTILFAALALRERPSARQFVGVCVGAAGLAVVGLGRAEHTPALAVLLTVAAAASWAVGNVVTRAAKVSSGLSLVVWSALVVPLPLLALSALLDGPAAMGAAWDSVGPTAVASTLFTAVLSTLVCYSIWYRLLAQHPAAEVVPYILLVPPVGMVSAAIVLGERPTVAEWVGTAVVLAGVAVASLRGGGAPRPKTAADDGARVPA